MNFTHKQFSLIIHLIVAFVFLSATFEPYLPVEIYHFVEKNRNTIFGVYYVYLAYEIYMSINIESPVNSPFASPISGTFE